jgi:hypothetical protein
MDSRVSGSGNPNELKRSNWISVEEPCDALRRLNGNGLSTGFLLQELPREIFCARNPSNGNFQVVFVDQLTDL